MHLYVLFIFQHMFCLEHKSFWSCHKNIYSKYLGPFLISFWFFIFSYFSFLINNFLDEPWSRYHPSFLLCLEAHDMSWSWFSQYSSFLHMCAYLNKERSRPPFKSINQANEAHLFSLAPQNKVSKRGQWEPQVLSSS